jgi:hypothetical protein
MMHADQVEELIMLVSGLGREALLRQFREYPANFPVDFTPEFLERQSLDRLRHLFVAVCLQSKRLPEMAESELAAVA